MSKIKDEIMQKITDYQSLLLIFSILASQGKTILQQDCLTSILYDSRNKYPCLFKDIVFQKRIDYLVSPDIENNLNSLLTFGAISRLSDKIIINITKEEAEDKLKCFDSKHITAAKEISKIF